MKASTFVYLILMGILFVLGLLLLQQNVFGRLHIIKDNPDILNQSDNSVPTELTIRHRAWGEQTIEDGNEIQRITNLLKQMKTATNEDCPAGMTTFTGTLRFLNGTSWSFSLGEGMILNGRCIAAHPLSQTTMLKARLLNAYHNPQQLSQQVTQAEEVILFEAGRSRKIDSRLRKVLEEKIKKAEPMTDYEEVGRALNSSDKPRVLQIARYANETGKRDNLMNITIYDALFSVQYMDDDNGNTFYLKGSLASVWKGAKRR